MKYEQLKEKLAANNLKITPQRIAVLEAVNKLQNHPSTERVIAHIQKSHPNIAIGTVYKILETFAQKGIISKVNTSQEKMRYDAITQKHHHLYSIDDDHIEDYFDEDLNDMLEKYFDQKKIPGFRIQDIRVEIRGAFQKSINHSPQNPL
jgi:Fur family peroxide stress response transcriptional regulator